MQKFIHQFKRDDIVHFYGARFECLEDARESRSHGPYSDHLTRAHGPCDCADNTLDLHRRPGSPSYIQHGKEWTFQGNHRAGTYEVEA